tara:strand:- start:291 stop:419 length:129 start_codon:yes stop_codon:yes gene_type:complete
VIEGSVASIYPIYIDQRIIDDMKCEGKGEEGEDMEDRSVIID